MPPGGSVWVYVTVINPRYSLLNRYCVACSWPLCTNMTSSIKPEVHNVSQRCQRRTEPRTYRLTRRGKFWWRLDMQFRWYARGQTNKQTDRQTDRHGHYNTPPLYRGRSKYHERVRDWHVRRYNRTDKSSFLGFKFLGPPLLSRYLRKP